MNAARRSTNRHWLLTGGLVAAAAWAFNAECVRPLQERERSTRRRVAELNEQVDDARAAIEAIRVMEKQAELAKADLDRWTQARPAGSAAAWLPELVKGHFARFGIVVPLVRLNTTLAAPGLPGYQRGYWSLSLPIDETGRKMNGLLFAVAELDRPESIVKVLDFAIRPDPEDPRRRIAALNVSALIRE